MKLLRVRIHGYAHALHRYTARALQDHIPSPDMHGPHALLARRARPLSPGCQARCRARVCPCFVGAACCFDWQFCTLHRAAPGPQDRGPCSCTLLNVLFCQPYSQSCTVHLSPAVSFYACRGRCLLDSSFTSPATSCTSWGRSLLKQLALLYPCTALAERSGPSDQPADLYVLVSSHAWSATDRHAAACL